MAFFWRRWCAGLRTMFLKYPFPRLKTWNCCSYCGSATDLNLNILWTGNMENIKSPSSNPLTIQPETWPSNWWPAINLLNAKSMHCASYNPNQKMNSGFNSCWEMASRTKAMWIFTPSAVRRPCRYSQWVSSMLRKYERQDRSKHQKKKL